MTFFVTNLETVEHAQKIENLSICFVSKRTKKQKIMNRMYEFMEDSESQIKWLSSDDVFADLQTSRRESLQAQSTLANAKKSASFQSQRQYTLDSAEPRWKRT